jgi:hypothetical protein
MLQHINWDKHFKLPSSAQIYNTVQQYNLCKSKLDNMIDDIKYIDNCCYDIRQFQIFQSNNTNQYYDTLYNQLILNYWKYIISRNRFVNYITYQSNMCTNVPVISSEVEFTENNIIKIYDDIKEQFKNQFYKLVFNTMTGLSQIIDNTIFCQKKIILTSAIYNDWVNDRVAQKLLHLEIILSILENNIITNSVLNMDSIIRHVKWDNKFENKKSFRYYYIKWFNNGNVHVIFHKNKYNLIDKINQMCMIYHQEQQLMRI